MTIMSQVPHFHYLLHPYPTSLVTCIDSGGKPNVIAIAWIIPVSAEPPLVAMSIRPTRYSYSLLVRVPEFVVNVPSYDLAEKTLYCGRRSGRTEDKLTAVGLTPAPARHVRPPIIEECPAHIECRIVNDIEAGDHHLVIGEVVAAYARPEFTNQEGLRNLSETQPLLHLGRNWFTNLRGDTSEPTLSD
jgi:flavin reductase (DIM6/NTAB) family NADH-FMN oxidoreductase RutF